jgi:hypothetical protein
MSTWRLLQAPIDDFDRNPHRTDMTQPPGQPLPAHQLRTLLSLAERQPGQASNFVNIAAAQALTAQGLARHGGGGWEITPLGRNHLLNLAPRDGDPGAANAR